MENIKRLINVNSWTENSIQSLFVDCVVNVRIFTHADILADVIRAFIFSVHMCVCRVGRFKSMRFKSFFVKKSTVLNHTDDSTYQVVL